MGEIRGTPITIVGRTLVDAATPWWPGPAPITVPMRVPIPVPFGRQQGGGAASFQDPGLVVRTTFARHLRIRNLDGANNLQVYIGGTQNLPSGKDGSAFVTIFPKSSSYSGEEEFFGNIPYFLVMGVGGVVQWEAYCVTAG